ncbi:beta-1,3-galactosyltransferase 2-like [Syngnathus acus]|uniref:beta-1,3-galactosyltransferase 2-like n=1 Tax=Syngnathus acus TaxID=161584 RepID=UPI00188646E2|nr:beta-1,3-galactosyltransferase 2-like [Syngnathus acus]
MFFGRNLGKSMQMKRRHCCVRSAKLALGLCLAAALLIFLLGRFGSDKTRVSTNISTGTCGGTQNHSSIRSPSGLENSKLAHGAAEDCDDTAIQTLFPYIINQADKCRERLAAPFLVFLITTEAWQVYAREAIRLTWANETLIPGVSVVRLFLLGRPGEGQMATRLQRLLRWESQKYHDLIQQDFLDSYNNLTLKTLMGLHWVARYCSGASYVMKTDCDMFINTENLVWKLLRPEREPRMNYFTGKVLRDSSPFRDNSSKWYISTEEYPERTYPPFCSGTGYVFSGDLAGKIYETSRSMRLMHLEDVHVALCLAKLGLEPSDPPNIFLFNILRVSARRCEYNRLITSHGFKPNEIVQYWRMQQRNKAKCTTMGF